MSNLFYYVLLVMLEIYGTDYQGQQYPYLMYFKVILNSLARAHFPSFFI